MYAMFELNKDSQGHLSERTHSNMLFTTCLNILEFEQQDLAPVVANLVNFTRKGVSLLEY